MVWHGQVLFNRNLESISTREQEARHYLLSYNLYSVPKLIKLTTIATNLLKFSQKFHEDSMRNSHNFLKCLIRSLVKKNKTSAIRFVRTIRESSVKPNFIGLVTAQILTFTVLFRESLSSFNVIEMFFKHVVNGIEKKSKQLFRIDWSFCNRFFYKIGGQMSLQIAWW